MFGNCSIQPAPVGPKRFGGQIAANTGDLSGWGDDLFDMTDMI